MPPSLLKGEFVDAVIFVKFLSLIDITNLAIEAPLGVGSF